MASNFDRVFGNYENTNTFDEMIAPYLDDTVIRGRPREDVRIPSKMDEVVIAAEERTRDLENMVSPYQVAAVRRTGTGLPSIQNPVQRDMATLNAWDMIQHYGENAGDLISQAAAGQNMFEFDRRSSGTVSGSRERTNDVLLGLGQGFANGIGGLTSLALGGVDNVIGTEMGTWSAERLGDFNEYIDSNKSDASEIQRRLYGTVSGLTQADNEQAYEEEKVRDGEFVAGLRRFGRDAVDTLGHVWGNNEVLRDTIAQGTGSLLAGGPIAKLIKGIGKATLGRAIAARAGTESAAYNISSRLGNASAMPIAIGGMEGGGAYQQAVAEAYSILDQRDDLTDSEKAEIANRAGLEAATIQAPIGAVTGLLTSRFEASPFSPRGLGSVTRNIAKEGVEESFQGASGQLATNIAIRSNVDEDRELSEGAGENAALGLVGGIGAAGVTQAPGAALRTSVESAKFVGRQTARAGRAGVDAVMRGISDRNERVLERIESESPVSEARMDQAIDAARNTAPNISSELEESFNSPENSFTQEERQSVVEHFDKVLNFDASSEAEQAPESIRGEVSSSTDRFDVVRRVAEIAKDEAQPEERRLSAGLYLMETLRRNESMLENVPEEALAKLPQDDPAVTQIEDYQTVLDSLSRHPLVRDAIGRAVELSSNISEEDVSDKAIGTPRGQETAMNAVKLASLAPEKTSPKVNDRVLLHAEQGKVNLTPNQKGYLRSANAVHEANRIHSERSSDLGLTPSEVVSREIQTDKSNPSTLHKSAISHMEGVIAAVESDNMPLAKRRMRHFASFAQSMQNKVSALNESLLSGKASEKNRTSYKAYNPRTGQFFDSKPGAYLIGSSRGSIAQAQQTAVDAEAVAYVANELSNSFPDLGIEQVEVVPLHASMSQTSAREAARDYRVAQNEGALGEFLSLSEETSPNNPVDAALNSTQQEEQAENQVTQVTEAEPNTEVQKSEEAPQETAETVNTSETQPAEQKAEKEETRPTETKEVEAKVEQTPDIQENENQETEGEVEENSDTKPERRSIEVAFPSLIGSTNSGDNTQENLFKSSFDIPSQEPISRLTAQEESIPLVQRALKSANNFRNFLGEQVGTNSGRITTELSRAYEKLLELAPEVASLMDQRLSNISNERSKKKKKFDLGFEELRAMNIADSSGKKYEPSLRDGAVLAGMQWLLTSEQRQRPLDAEDVSKLLGIPINEVTTEQVEKFNQGSYLASSVSEMADVITRFWGVTPVSSAPHGVVRGIPEGVAKEVLISMTQVGLVRINEIQENGKTYYQVESLIREKLGEQNYSELISWPSAIEVASVVEPQETSFIGSPPKEIPSTQLRNPLVRLTREQREMVENEQATPHRINLEMTSFLEDLGEENSLALFGHGDLSEDGLNVNHKRSLESINLSIRSAYRAIFGKLAEARSWGEANDVKDPSEVPIHYAYEFTSVNRLQMVGAHNPQSNKLTREAILPTWSTLDLTDPGDRSKFMIGLAQGLGVKVHKIPRRDAIKRVSEMLSGALSGSVEVIRNRRTGSPVTEEEIQILRNELGNDGPVPAVALHSIMEYAKYLDSNVESKKEFRTGIYLEADGITDGPVNAMVHAARGLFNKNWVKVVGKGGLFLGQPGMTANKSPDKVDLYEHTTNFLRQTLSRTRSELGSNSSTGDVARQMDRLLRMMSQLLPDLTIDDQGQLIVDRGLVKNPLTVTIYGAGPTGIAAKITEALTGAIYERESKKVSFLKDRPKASKSEIAVHLFGDVATSSEHAERLYDEYNSEMSQLVNQRVQIGEEGLLLVDETSDLPDNKSMRDGPQGFTMLPRQVQNLRENVLRLLVRPMRESIEASIGETTQGVDALRRSTQVQSIYLEHAFRRAVQQKLDEKKKSDPSFRKSDFLTGEELSEIYDSLRHLAPFIRTESQNMLVSGSEKAPVGEGDSSLSFSRSLDGKLSTPASVFGPANSGVSGIPYVIIGTGDGLMMQKVSTMAGAPEGTLKIFDGMNMPLDKIEDQSRMVNEAVYRGWMENPLEAVSNSYSEFVRDGNLEITSEQMRSELSEALLGPGKDGASAEEITEMVKGLQEEMSQIAREIQARKNVLSRVQMTVDHMASAESPHDEVNGKISLEGLPEDEVISVLNELYVEELNKISEADEKSKKTTENSKATNVFGEFEQMPAENLVRFVSQLDLEGDQRRLAIEAARALEKTDWTVTSSSSGSDNQTADIEVKGYADFGSRRIVVRNGSVETLTHEMIHAATLDKVAAYYDQNSETQSTLSREETDAIARIEVLMGEWLENIAADLPNLNEAGRRAMLSAQSTVLGHLGDGTNSSGANKANALNEFMSWVLSNQDLVRAASRRKVRNPIARVVGEVLDYLKKLVGIRAPGSDILSNLRFNTSILLGSNLRGERSVAGTLSDTILYQSSDFGSNDRITRLRKSFFDKVASHLTRQPNPAARATEQYKAFVAKVQADAVFESFDAHGFPMDAQQASTFQMMVSALATEIELNPNSLQRVQALFEHVTKTIKPVDFRENPEDPNDNADEFQAQEKYRSLTGTYLTEIDEQGRSTLLPAFLALAAVNDGFREVLSRMPMPEGDRLPNDTLDNRLTNLGSEMMDRLSFLVSGEEGAVDSVRHLGRSGASSVGSAIDALTDKLAEVDDDQRSRIEQFVEPAGTALDKANDYVVSQMRDLSRKTSDKLEEVKQKSQGDTARERITRTAANFGQLMTGIVNEDVAGDQARSVMSLANKSLSSKTAHEFLNELVGRTTENAPIYDMIKTVRSAVHSVRQQFRENLPQLLEKRFVDPVSSERWSVMFRGMALTDLASLRVGSSGKSGYSLNEIVKFLGDPVEVSKQATVLETKIRSKPNGALMLQKARELADFMSGGQAGKAPVNLLRNARAIERLLNQGARVSPEVDLDLVSDIDHLVSLYSLGNLSDFDKAELSSLVRDEQDGLSFVLSYLEGQRRDEISKVESSTNALFNHFKGHIPQTQSGKHQGRTLVVADDLEFVEMRRRGMTRVADYEGTRAENYRGKMGYYFSSLSGRSAYNQGVAQTARSTASGVDPVTGFSTSVMTAGRITDPDAVQKLQKRLSRSSGASQGTSQGNEQLMPVFDPDGVLVAYERSVDPSQEKRLGRSTDLPELMGVWRGRQVEEVLGQKFNEVLIDRLHDIWDAEEVSRRDEYVNVMDPREQKRDPVMADAVNLIPREARQRIEDLFGEDQFWVRRDMVNDAIGYRKASVGDNWTGVTRYSEQTQKSVRDLATSILGADAYKKMVQAETIAQNVVTDARVLIVVKSVIVPFANLMANIYQLTGRGVPLKDTVKGMPKKLSEVNGYVKDRLRVMEIEAELRAAEGAGNVVRIRKLGAEKQSIEDGFRRLSIWPLIEAGELTSVSDVGIGKEELELSNGRLTNYMETAVQKLPPGVKTAGRYFIIGRDTALFKGLQKSIEYGDFLAKAILYEDLTKRQGLSREEALARVTEEYVNYDRLAGRSRDYLENMGLMWFWNFKVRSTKIALSMIRNNPVHAMLSLSAPTPPMVGTVGSPLTDNLLSIGADGRLDYSVGPGQGLRAHQLLPWIQLID